MNNDQVGNVASEQEAMSNTEVTTQPRLLTSEEVRAVAGGPYIVND